MSSGNRPIEPPPRKAVQPPPNLSCICRHLAEAAKGKKFFPNREKMEAEIIRADGYYRGDKAQLLVSWLLNVGIILCDRDHYFVDDERARVVNSSISSGTNIPPCETPRLKRIDELKKKPLGSRPFADALKGVRLETDSVTNHGSIVPTLDERVRIMEEVRGDTSTASLDTVPSACACGIETEGYKPASPFDEIRFLALPADVLSRLSQPELDKYINDLDRVLAQVKDRMAEALARSDEGTWRRTVLGRQVETLEGFERLLAQKIAEVRSLIAAKTEEIAASSP